RIGTSDGDGVPRQPPKSLMTPTDALRPVGARLPPGLCPQQQGYEMTGLPSSLSIALWFTGSIWVVGILAYAFDAPVEIVLATFAIGLVGGIAEWLIRGGRPR